MTIGELFDALVARLIANPPPGVEAAYIERFAQRNRYARALTFAAALPLVPCSNDRQYPLFYEDCRISPSEFEERLDRLIIFGRHCEPAFDKSPSPFLGDHRACARSPDITVHSRHVHAWRCGPLTGSHPFSYTG